jgi:hypothetical protein
MTKKIEKRPVGLFMFGADWRAEPTLMVSSEGARLLWFEMLLHMAESEQRGFLLFNGRKPTPREVAILTRTDPEKVEERLAELEANGVFSRDRRGVIYSRKIVRDEKKAAKSRANGHKGGNPALRVTQEKHKEIPPQDNPQDNPDDKPGVKPITLPPSSTPTPEEESPTLGSSAPTKTETQKRPEGGAKAALWAEMKLWVGGKDPARLIGAWVRDHGEGPVFAAYFKALKVQPAEPKSWMVDELKRAKAGPRPKPETPPPEPKSRMVITREKSGKELMREYFADLNCDWADPELAQAVVAH